MFFFVRGIYLIPEKNKLCFCTCKTKAKKALWSGINVFINIRMALRAIVSSFNQAKLIAFIRP